MFNIEGNTGTAHASAKDAYFSVGVIQELKKGRSGIAQCFCAGSK
jgi:hypothetical protein